MAKPPHLRIVGGRSDRSDEHSEAAPAARPQHHLVGDLLRFQHGKYFAGWDNQEIALGTQLLALLPTLRIGWLRWEHGRCIAQITGRVADRFSPPPRQSLPRGEWVAIHQLVLADLIGGRICTLSTSTLGGQTAVGKLCKEYGRHLRVDPLALPIIALGADHYPHPRYGTIAIPLLKIVDWR